jgi:hypothetical protein
MIIGGHKRSKPKKARPYLTFQGFKIRTEDIFWAYLPRGLQIYLYFIGLEHHNGLK